MQHSSAVLHVEWKAHKAVYDLFLKAKGKSANERADILKESLWDNRQVGIIDSINIMNIKDFELTKKKFEVAYFIAKEELQLSLFPKLLNLWERHGVELGTAYWNHNYAGKIIDYISEELANDLKVALTNANFYSVLTDGSIDAFITEKEATFTIHFDPSPIGEDYVKICTSYLDLADLKNANSRWVIGAINDSFKSIGIDTYMDKLVEFGSDGASVNREKKEGVKTLLQESNK